MPRREFVSHRLSVAALVVGVSSLLSSLAMAQEKQSVKVLELDHVSICGPDLDALRQASREGKNVYHQRAPADSL